MCELPKSSQESIKLPRHRGDIPQPSIIKPTYLSGKDMLNFTGSDTKGQGAKGSVSCRVRVSTNSDTTREREPLLGSNNVDNPLTLVGKGKVLESKVLDILFQG